MPEDKPYQIRLPEPEVQTPLPVKSQSRESMRRKPEAKRSGIYTLSPGTLLFNAPSGGPHRIDGATDKSWRAHMIERQVVGGDVSFYVEVESPPEVKGRRHWVTLNKKGKGFAKHP